MTRREAREFANGHGSSHSTCFSVEVCAWRIYMNPNMSIVDLLIDINEITAPHFEKSAAV